MKILFITPVPHEGASTRMRIEQYLDKLNNEKIEYRISPFLDSRFFAIVYKKGNLLKKIFYFVSSSLRRIGDILNARRFDCVFIHREAFPFGPPFFEWIINLLGVPIIYDFDDAIYLSSPNVKSRIMSSGFLRCYSKVPKIIKMSKAVIVCNEYLKNYCLKFNQNVYIIPTSIDTDKFSLKENHAVDKMKPFIIGWVGSHTTAPYLKSLENVFKRLSKKYDFILRVIGAGRDFKIGFDKTELTEWHIEREVSDFQDLDIGVYPLSGNNWDLGKTGFKTVQYLAVGVPCVVSNVGSNREIIKDGVSGFLAETEDEWVDKISAIIENPQIYKRFVEEGRKTVEQRYSIKANYRKFLEVIKSAKE